MTSLKQDSICSKIHAEKTLLAFADSTNSYHGRQTPGQADQNSRHFVFFSVAKVLQTMDGKAFTLMRNPIQ